MSTQPIPKKNRDYLLQSMSKDKEFQSQIQWTLDTLNKDFDIKIDYFTAVSLVGFQLIAVNSLNNVRENGPVIYVIGDKGQDLQKPNPAYAVYSDAIKSITSIYREIGLTPKARIEFQKLQAETEQATSEMDLMFKNYLGGLPQ